MWVESREIEGTHGGPKGTRTPYPLSGKEKRSRLAGSRKTLAKPTLIWTNVQSSIALSAPTLPLHLDRLGVPRSQKRGIGADSSQRPIRSESRSIAMGTADPSAP
jgi:hypothetical protein